MNGLIRGIKFKDTVRVGERTNQRGGNEQIEQIMSVGDRAIDESTLFRW